LAWNLLVLYNWFYKNWSPSKKKAFTKYAEKYKLDDGKEET
jgi:hypothetical protein